MGGKIAEEAPALADRLWLSRIEGRPCAPLTESSPELTIPNAYRISRMNLERRLRGGERLRGRKIGLTSAAVQRQLGVDQPDFGYLTSAMEISDGGKLSQGALLQGKVEGEAAFVMRKDLRGPGIGLAQVQDATESVAVCIEIIDSRIRDWKIKIQDTIADNASAAFFVLGSRRTRLSEIDLKKAKMSLRMNGEIKSTGEGTACLGDPALAVAWLANALGELGDGLSAGDIVLSGAFGPVVPFKPGDRCEVEIEGLGKVSCSY